MNELSLAVRSLARAPGLATLIVLTLALGTGAFTAMFTVVNSVLLRPVAYPASERLVVIEETKLPEHPRFRVAPANYLDWSDATGEVFESMAASFTEFFSLTGHGEPVRVTGTRVTGRYFEALRAQPGLGRLFGLEEQARGQNRIAVVSHAFWLNYLGARPNAVGETIRLNGWALEVIGVLPADFQRGATADVFVPLPLDAAVRADRENHYLDVVARLRPGVSIDQARSTLEAVAARLAQQYPGINLHWGTRITPLLEFTVGNSRPLLYTLLAAAIILLLIACANAANFLLARATSRQREFSIKVALGASRGRILRQMLAESLLLALAGGALGVFFAHWGLPLFLSLAPAGLPRAAEIALDGPALAVALAVTLLTGVGFGLAPAWQATRVNVADSLQQGSRGAGESGRRHALRHGLVVAEFSLAVMLLACAGLLGRSVLRLSATDPGFRTSGALQVEVALPWRNYEQPAQQRAFAEAVIARYQALPGVTDVAATSALPMTGNETILGVQTTEETRRPSDLPGVTFFAVTPGYFKTAGIWLSSGREFSTLDRPGSPPVMIVSQAFARAQFPGENPIGKRVLPVTSGPPVWREIVGVVADVRQSGFRQIAAPQTYVPFAQNPFSAMSFVVRADGDVNALAHALRQELLAVDPNQPAVRVEPLDRLISAETARDRFALALVTAFSGIALILAVGGVSGVMAYSVAQRTGEFGLRLALGAQRRHILQLVLARGARLIAAGLAVGLSGTLIAGRLVGSLLYQTSPSEPLVLGIVALVISATALLACLLPAWSATRVDPMVALRTE